MARIILLILLIWLWNYFPYSYDCYSYPLAGCSETVFWWELPTDWSSYRGIKWGAYFSGNIFGTAIFVVVFWAIKKGRAMIGK
jgi:hypothetical protein